MAFKNESLQSWFAASKRLLRNPSLRHAFLVVLSYFLLFAVFFSPVIFRGALLAVGGDGLYLYLPNFYSRKVLWDTMIFSGFPMLADPQVMTWYPPAFVLSLLPSAWNLFIVLAYVCASSLMYGYVYSVTRSRIAAFVSGVVYGMSGFMMAHLGHAVIIHVAAWIPLIIWSLEMLRHRVTAKWIALGALGVGLCFVAGHSQIFVYAMLIASAYVIVFTRRAPTGRWRYFAASVALVTLGFGLSAVQIVPTAELIGQTIRAGYPYNYFIAYSLPPRQALAMIFPFVFGGARWSGALPYFGAENQTELAGYVGLLPLMLAAIAIIASRRRSLVVFWLFIAVGSFVLVLGDSTPLARILFHVPILNSFRAPGRHFIELTFAVSVLSGLGVAAILEERVSASQVRKLILLAAGCMAICLGLLFVNAGYMSRLASQSGIAQLQLAPWSNRTVAIPLLIFLLSATGLAYWFKKPTSARRQIVFLFVLIIDLASFGWFYEWRYVPVAANAANPPPSVNFYKTDLQAANQRMISYRGLHESRDMRANLTRLWGVPNAGGNNVLMLSRIDKLLPMVDELVTPLPWSESQDTSLDMMAVRYLFFPQYDLTKDASGISWIKDDARFWLGSNCNVPPRKSAALTLPQPVHSTALGIVSRLGCSPPIADGTEVVRLRVTDAEGKSETHSLLAGRDSSEWAYDCAEVTPQMRHRRASIFSNYPSEISHVPCQAHFYVTTVPFDAVKDVRSIDFEYVAGQGAIILDKLSLINQGTKASYPIDTALFAANVWKKIEETDTLRVYENKRVLPRAWLTSEVASVDADAALNIIKAGTFKDGRAFDPRQVALVEGAANLPSSPIDTNASATVTKLVDNQMDVRTSAKTATFLITSDVYYPGWRARIDGAETQLYRADYAIRGVLVPAGEHFVQFEYKPKSFLIGAAVSLVALLVVSALILGPIVRRQNSHGGIVQNP